MSEVRTRFAPSPTGNLHIGGARTALFCWLYARHHGGKFILRVDDTDRERSTKEMERVIMDAMEWLKLDYDEGPFYQSQRTELYDEAIQRLWEADKLFRCVCTPEELDAKRKAAMKAGKNPRYDGTCRNRNDISPDEPHVLRFKSPRAGETVIDDAIQGPVTFPNAELDDLIVRRTDGSPTYNLTTVVDDVDLGITHVIRGADHLNNTPRQYQIFEALCAEPPVFAHMPLTLGPDKTKLSKRHGDTALIVYRDKGFLPEAMLNYIVRLGWSHGDQEIFSMAELVEKFDLDGCTRSPGIFDVQKLTWVNEQHIQKLDPAELGRRLIPFLDKSGIDLGEGGPELTAVAASLQQRAKTLVEMAEGARFYFEAPDSYDEKAARKNLKPEAVDILKAIADELGKMEMTREWAMKMIHHLAEKHSIKLGKIAQPLRVALTGGSASPPIDDVMVILGAEECVRRIEKAIEFIESGQ